MKAMTRFYEFLYNEADDCFEYNKMLETVEASMQSKRFSEAIETINRLYRDMFGSDFFDEKSDEEFNIFLNELGIDDPADIAIAFMNAWLTYEEENVDVPDIDDPVLGLRAELRRAY